MLVFMVLFFITSGTVCTNTQSQPPQSLPPNFLHHLTNYTASRDPYRNIYIPNPSDIFQQSVQTITNITNKFFYNIRDIQKHFGEFIQIFRKSYKSLEEMTWRMKIFTENLMLANELNSEHPLTQFGYTEFSDLTPAEFRSRHIGLGDISSAVSCQTQRRNDFHINWRYMPMSFDWRGQGAVTQVKHQGGCNSCFAWAAIGNLEGQYAIKYRRLVDFSPQQIIDCDPISHGCKGGWITNAGVYLNYMGAIAERDYPVSAKQGPCRADPNRVTARVIGCRQFLNIDEEALRRLLVEVGPLTVAISAEHFNIYKSGIFTKCGTVRDHALLLIGYGEENGVPYWILKNTYGIRWGERGYIRIPRNKNACGIISDQIVSVIVA